MRVDGLEQPQGDPSVLHDDSGQSSCLFPSFPPVPLVPPSSNMCPRLTIVMRCMFPPLYQHHSSGLPTVPMPRTMISIGCAYLRAQMRLSAAPSLPQTKGRDGLGGKPERRAVLVVELVDVLVDRLVVQRPVRKVVPCVLHEEEQGELTVAVQRAGWIASWAYASSPGRRWSAMTGTGPARSACPQKRPWGGRGRSKKRDGISFP